MLPHLLGAVLVQLLADVQVARRRVERPRLARLLAVDFAVRRLGDAVEHVTVGEGRGVDRPHEVAHAVLDHHAAHRVPLLGQHARRYQRALLRSPVGADLRPHRGERGVRAVGANKGWVAHETSPTCARHVRAVGARRRDARTRCGAATCSEWQLVSGDHTKFRLRTTVVSESPRGPEGTSHFLYAAAIERQHTKSG
eukprot:1251423-Prymnesium_polylepis.1